MLRITIHDNPGEVILQLEGRLVGPWLLQLQECWQSVLHRRDSIRRVDLTDVTFIDAAGKALLATMHREGAAFIACDCLTKATVAEIRSQGTEVGGQKSEVRDQKSEVEDWKSEDRSRRTEVGGQMTDTRSRRADL